MITNTLAQTTRTRQLSAIEQANRDIATRAIRRKHERWQMQMEARRQAENQRFADAMRAIKAEHGDNWQRYAKSDARRYETIIFGDPFGEDTVTVEFHETVTKIKRYGDAPNYFSKSTTRAFFSLLNS